MGLAPITTRSNFIKGQRIHILRGGENDPLRVVFERKTTKRTFQKEVDWWGDSKSERNGIGMKSCKTEKNSGKLKRLENNMVRRKRRDKNYVFGCCISNASPLWLRDLITNRSQIKIDNININHFQKENCLFLHIYLFDQSLWKSIGSFVIVNRSIIRRNEGMNERINGKT